MVISQPTTQQLGGAAAASFPAELLRARAVMLTTFRASGAGVGTPVWAVGRNGRLYVQTVAASGKIARIRSNPRVEVAPCTQRGRLLGAAVPARARLLDDADARAIDPAFHRRYPVVYRLYEVVNRIRGKTQVYLELLPA